MSQNRENGKNGGQRVKNNQSKKIAIESTLKIDLKKIDDDKAGSEIELMLRNCLSNVFLHPDKVTIDWKKEANLKSLPKKEKREQIKIMKQSKKLEIIDSEQIKVEVQTFIVLGFNKVVKEIQRDEVKTVIVNPGISENILMFLLPLCKMKNVNILGLPRLDQIITEIVGFRSSVIGLTNEAENEHNHFHQIWRRVSNAMSVSDNKSVPISQIVQVECFEHGKAIQTNIQTIIKSKDKDRNLNNLLLKRTNINERMFVPGGIKRRKETHDEKCDGKYSDISKKSNFPYYESILL